MKIAIIKNNYEQSKMAATKIEKLLNKNHTITTEDPEVIIALGGDGTFLRAFQKYWHKNHDIQFFAIHSGTLGFYSDYTCSEIEMFVKAFEQKEYEIEETQALELNINKKTHFALNDIRIEAGHKTAVLDVKVNGIFLERFRGNGLCFSTKTGSTAYNKSLGGAIMWPSTLGFQMTEVAPIKNNAFSSVGSSIIFSSIDNINLSGEFEESFFTFDTNCKDLEGKLDIEIKIAQKKVKIGRFKKHYNFFKRLQDGFIK